MRTVSIKVTTEEYARFIREAGKEPMSAYLRKRLKLPKLAEAKRQWNRRNLPRGLVDFA